MDQKNCVKLILNNFSEVDEIIYNWNIPNYNLHSAYFENLKLKDDLECTLMLVPKKIFPSNESKKYIIRVSTAIAFTKVPDDGHHTWFSYSMRSTNNFPLAYAAFRKAQMSNASLYGDKDNLSSENYRIFINKNNSLCLNVELLLDDTGNSSIGIKKGHSQLSKDFCYNNIKYPDITLFCDNNEKLPANKAVLAGRSPVFAKFLAEEIDTFVIEGSYSKDNVMAFLQLLYTGIISRDEFEANSIELMELASKYEVSDLTNLFQQHLLIDCKTEIAYISTQMEKLTGEDIIKSDNFAEIHRCIKNLYRCTKDISMN